MSKLKYGMLAKVKETGKVGKVSVIDELLDDVEMQFEKNEFKHFKIKQLEPVEKSNQKPTGADLHRSIIDDMHNIFLRKNADYGNSFSAQFDEYGLLSSLIRLDDKMRRLKQLSKQDAQVKDESILDTLLDLANYSVMTIMELKK